MVRLVSECFGHDAVGRGSVINLQEIYPERFGLREADAVFSLDGNLYHIECQVANDPHMPIRMLEYDFAIGLANVGISERGHEFGFPRSCILNLRGKTTLRPPEVHISFPDGAQVAYGYRKVWLSKFELDEVFDKRLYILLPFWPIRLEDRIKSVVRGEDVGDEVLAELSSILPRLAEEVGEDSLVYNIVSSVFTRVGTYIISGDDDFSKKARSAMGGEVWELPFEKIERLEREAWERGLSDGREQGLKDGRAEGMKQGLKDGRVQGLKDGREQGLRDGREQGLADGIAEGKADTCKTIAANLRALGVDESIIERAIAV